MSMISGDSCVLTYLYSYTVLCLMARNDTITTKQVDPSWNRSKGKKKKNYIYCLYLALLDDFKQHTELQHK